MFDIRWIRENAEAFDRALVNRGKNPLSAELLAVDDERRALMTEAQAAQAKINSLSKEIGRAKAAKDEAGAAELMEQVSRFKSVIHGLEASSKKSNEQLDARLAEIPNVPQADVPVGKDEHDNVEVRRVGTPRAFDFEPKQHFDIGEKLGLMDFDRAAKVSGARFVFLKGKLARLERALGQFMLDLHTEQHGYTEVDPPFLIKTESAYGTGNLPKFEEDLFKTSRRTESSEKQRMAWKEATIEYFEKRPLPPGGQEAGVFGDEFFDLLNSKLAEPLWLVPTAEVPLTNLVREEILDETALPHRYTAWTPCFRSEAGSAGRDTRGMIRQHQFLKVELVSITTPEQSAAEHERMTASAEAVLKALDLPFRTITLCTGDMGFASQKTYDIEVWLPGQGAYREISSCSNCGDFQARRMNARYRPAEGKGTRFVHTLNGSGVAVGRALVAVLENYQNADGSVTIPTVLRPYMGGIERIEPV